MTETNGTTASDFSVQAGELNVFSRGGSALPSFQAQPDDTADKSKGADAVFTGSDNFSITVKSAVIDITARIGSQEEADRFVECLRQVVEIMAGLSEGS